ncbi:P-loop containing nucleoside triphosphate hydrolase protein, partial [Wilcoxina mikolae CBS 423.85]
AVIGLTGAGKSHIIKSLTGSDAHVEPNLSAGTASFEMFPTIIDNQPYIFIDTPGFNDQTRSDLEIFQEILDWFVAMTPYCDLTGILYVHDITKNRFDGATSTNLDMLQALCGKEFYKNITIITTMWNTMNATTIKAAQKRQKQLEI